MDLLDVALGKHRNARLWRNTQMTWDDLVDRCSATHYTAESLNDYMTAVKSRQDEIKDIGGFVGGYCVKGRRKRDTIQHRQLLTLDADFASEGIWESFIENLGCAGLMYSTHKHTPEKWRVRIVIPLDRPVPPDEHEPLARKVADMIGIEQFDHTTYDINRLMYWPSTSADGEFIFKEHAGDYLNADGILALYRNWVDASEWPVSSREVRSIQSAINKQADPLEKDGWVGLYCRTYGVPEVVQEHLPGVYESTPVQDRYTYLKGSTTGGMIIYDDKFAYSHHGTDPISGRLVNAFDLVRLHKFGNKDEDARPDTPSNRLPSYLAMVDYVAKDPAVRHTRDVEKLSEAGIDFADVNWMAMLIADRKGDYETSVHNIRVILEYDENLKGKFGLNQFAHRTEVLGPLPWNNAISPRPWQDEDWSGLRCYLGSAPYDLQRTPKIEDVMDGVKLSNAFHPVTAYLKHQSWDGVERLETLFIDYLGAEDSPYTRAVTRKALVACVARVFDPGCKFDHVLTLIGPQGTGKSTILRKMGGDWFSDNFSFHMLKNVTKAQEQIKGVWIMEIGEMAGLRKVEVEAAKSFLSSQQDEYRGAYGKELSYFKRQIVPFGSSNTRGFLKQAGGNRRFWPVDVYVNPPTLDIWDDLTPEMIGLLWAEAVEYYREGETLYLSDELELEAFGVQAAHEEQDDRFGIMQKFLGLGLPYDWDSRNVIERRAYLEMVRDGVEIDEKLLRRERVCAAEIWCEVFGKPQSEMSAHNTRFIHEFMRVLPDYLEAPKRSVFPNYGKQIEYVYSPEKEEETDLSA